MHFSKGFLLSLPLMDHTNSFSIQLPQSSWLFISLFKLFPKLAFCQSSEATVEPSDHGLILFRPFVMELSSVTAKECNASVVNFL